MTSLYEITLLHANQMSEEDREKLRQSLKYSKGITEFKKRYKARSAHDIVLTTNPYWHKSGEPAFSKKNTVRGCLNVQLCYHRVGDEMRINVLDHDNYKNYDFGYSIQSEWIYTRDSKAEWVEDFLTLNEKEVVKQMDSTGLEWIGEIGFFYFVVHAIQKRISFASLRQLRKFDLVSTAGGCNYLRNCYIHQGKIYHEKELVMTRDEWTAKQNTFFYIKS